jgi:hypothetical protein
MSRDVPKVLALVRDELVRAELVRLARFEDAWAAAEAEAVPYWASCPDSVQAHRMAAAALRARAEAVADRQRGAGGSAQQRGGVQTQLAQPSVERRA